MKILLDVHAEGLKKHLSGMGLVVITVTEVLGSSQEDRDDTNILNYAKSNDVAVVTDDKDLVKRLKSDGIPVVTLDLSDKAGMIREKLKGLES